MKQIITSTDSERMLSAASALHVSDEKWKGWLLLVNCMMIEIKLKTAEPYVF